MNLEIDIPGEDWKEPPQNPGLVPFPADVPYSLTQSGTFKKGEFQINERGIRIKGRRQRGASIGNGKGFAYDISEYEGLKSDDGKIGADEVVLEDLEIRNIVGKGHFGTVREVFHRPSQTKLALKSIPLEFGEDTKGELVREIELLLKIEHPNVVTFYGAFLREGSVLIVLEYLDYTLGDILLYNEHIPEKYLSRITKAVLDGLIHLEKVHKLVHRDIKPSNLLVNTDGQTKITDFGVSTQMQNSLQKCQTWVGSVTYMSPERITGGTYDYKSDIWSLGLTLYECAIGRYPYVDVQKGRKAASGRTGRPTFWDLLDSIVTQPVPTAGRDTLSVELNDFIDKCLQKDTEKRASAAELLKHDFITKYTEEIDSEFKEWVKKTCG